MHQHCQNDHHDYYNQNLNQDGFQIMIIVVLETEMFLLQSYYYFIQSDDKKLSV